MDEHPEWISVFTTPQGVTWVWGSVDSLTYLYTWSCTGVDYVCNDAEGITPQPSRTLHG